MTRYIVIPPDGAGPVTVEDGPAELRHLQAGVGGFIEAVPHDLGPFVTILCNADGKLEHLPVNLRASQIATLRPDDVLVGPVLVTGFDPGTGEVADLDPEVVDHVLICCEPAAELKPRTFTVQVRGAPGNPSFEVDDLDGLIGIEIDGQPIVGIDFAYAGDKQDPLALRPHRPHIVLGHWPDGEQWERIALLEVPTRPDPDTDPLEGT